MEMNRRKFIEAMAGGALAAREGFGQEKTLEQRFQEDEKRVNQLLETLQWLQDSIKASGITQERIKQLQEKGDTGFLRDLSTDLGYMEKFANVVKEIGDTVKQYKSRAQITDPEELKAVQGAFDSMEAELKEYENIFGRMKDSRWDMGAVENKLAITPKTLTLAGLGADTEKVQKALGGLPPSIMATLDRVQSGEETDMGGNPGNYYGHQSYLGDTSRRVLTLDAKLLTAPDFENRLKFELARNFNWDETDELSPTERVEWFQQAIELQSKSKLKDDSYEQRLQEFYKEQLEPGIKDGTYTEQRAQAILWKYRLNRFVHIATFRFMTDSKFGEQFSDEADFIKRWLDKANAVGSKRKIEIRTNQP